jgi:hypothetical protein
MNNRSMAPGPVIPQLPFEDPVQLHDPQAVSGAYLVSATILKL